MIVDIQAATVVFMEDFTEPIQVFGIKIPGQWGLELNLMDIDLGCSQVFQAPLCYQPDFFLSKQSPSHRRNRNGSKKSIAIEGKSCAAISIYVECALHCSSTAELFCRACGLPAATPSPHSNPIPDNIKIALSLPALLPLLLFLPVWTWYLLILSWGSWQKLDPRYV